MWYVECHEPAGEPDWNQLHSMLDDPAVMNAVYDWVEGAADVDFATWRPPLDADRIKAIRRSSSGLDDACISVREEMKEAGMTLIMPDALKVALTEYIPRLTEDIYSPKQIAAALQRAGFVKSERRYGSTPNTQRYVWSVDGSGFDMVSKDILAACEKSAQVILGLGSKY